MPLGLLAPGFAQGWLLAGALQLALAALAFALVRRRSGRWWLEAGALPPPTWRLRYTAILLALHLVLAVPAAATFAALSLAEGLVDRSGGFVAFGRDGMQVVERRYRAAGDEVVLVGMVHVGEPSLYRDLYASFVEERTVVLQEGVTGLDDLLGVPLSYEPIAAAAGLAMQPPIEALMPELQAGRPDGAEEWPHLRHADLDASEFSPQTLALLERLARLIRAPDPWAELAGFGDFARSAGPALWRDVEEDLVVRRNRHVIVELDRALEDYARVVIPWGALHMPGIEHGVLSRGFEPVGERRRLAVRYATLANGLRLLLRALAR